MAVSSVSLFKKIPKVPDIVVNVLVNGVEWMTVEKSYQNI